MRCFPTQSEAPREASVAGSVRLLVMDDDPEVRTLLLASLPDRGFDVTVAEDAPSGLRILSAHKFDVVLTDMSMPGLSGVELVAAIRGADSEVEVVVMTGNATVETAVAAVRHGAHDYIEKPIRMAELAIVLRRAVETGSLRGMVGLYEVSREMLGDLSSPELPRHILHLAGRVLRVDEVRLVLGGEGDDLQVVSSAENASHAPSTATVCDVSRVALRQGAPIRELGESVLPEGFASLLVFPLQVRDHVLGALSFWRRSGASSFSVTEMRRATVLAAEAAMALDNARLYREIQERMQELIATRAELVQSEKHAAMGRLAAGMAHEINTPTQFVGDSVLFLRDAFSDILGLVAEYRSVVASGALAAAPGLLDGVRRAEDAADVAYLAEQIPRAVERCIDGTGRVAEIVRAMKAFAHPDRKEKSPADLNRALQGAITVAHNELKYVADVETEFGELPLVACRVGEINQVFLNLLVNAAHAVGSVVGDSGNRGRVSVRTRTDTDHVVVEIADTGCGIPEDIRDRIFEPFFTTKDVGQGTGQGLAIAHTIVVEKHGGTISVDSELGKGTTFRVRLPIRETGSGEGVSP